MCRLKSAIVLRDKKQKGGYRLLMSPWTESHSDLITIHKLKDGARLTFARVEFSPPDMSQAYLPDTYKLKLDEERKPSWWTTELAESVTEQMRSYIRGIIVDGPVDLLIGGQFILAPRGTVRVAKECVLSAMCGGTLTEMWGGTLTEMRGGTLTAMRGGTLTAMWGGTLTAMWGGTLNAMRGGTLTEMRGGTLTAMWGGTLNAMWGGTLNAMLGGTLTEMRGGTLTAMWGGTLIKDHTKKPQPPAAV